MTMICCVSRVQHQSRVLGQPASIYSSLSEEAPDPPQDGTARTLPPALQNRYN